MAQAESKTSLTTGPSGVTITTTVPTAPESSAAPAKPMSTADIAKMAEYKHKKSYGFSSAIFGLGVIFFLIALILIFLVRRRRWRKLAYVILALAFIFMLIGAFVYTLSAPDRYCSKNPSDAACAKRYSS
jgi:hypothetical protein